MEKTIVTNETVIQDTLASALTYAAYLEHIENELAEEPANEEEKMLLDYLTSASVVNKKVEKTVKTES